MAKQVMQSGIMAKISAKLVQSHEKHKDDETTFGAGGELPAGIENGVARLVDIKFDTFKDGDLKGEVYFYARGVVVEPVEFEGQTIEGRNTSIMSPLCETPKRAGRKTFDDHLAWVYNELRKLGVSTKELDPRSLEALFAALREQGPHFKFRTWKGKPTPEYPDPRVNHSWSGHCEYTAREDAGGVEDATPPAPPPAAPTRRAANGPPAAGRSPVVPPAIAARANARPPAPAPAPMEEPMEEPAGGAFNEFNSDDDVDSLVARCNDGDDDAQQQLGDLARAAGYTDEEIQAASSWEAVGEMAQSAPAEASPGEWQPAKGDVFNYTPVDPKTKKPGKKMVEVTVETVHVKDQTVTVRRLDDNKTLKIAWSDLQSA